MSYVVTAMVRKARLPRTIESRCAAKAVLLALADRCDDDGQNAWPSVATIAAEAETNTRTVQECLRALKAHRLIDEQARPRQHRPTTYRLNLEAIEALSGVSFPAPLTISDLQESAPLTTPAAAHERAPEVRIPTSGVRIPTSGVSFSAPDPVLLNRSFELKNAASPQTAPAESTDDEADDQPHDDQRSPATTIRAIVRLAHAVIAERGCTKPQANDPVLIDAVEQRCLQAGLDAGRDVHDDARCALALACMQRIVGQVQA